MDEFRSRVRSLMVIRVTIVTLMLGLSLVFQATRGEQEQTFYVLIISTYALTIPSALLLPRLQSGPALTTFFWMQVGIDCLLETILVARTGGVESPFAVLYIVTVTAASLVPRRRTGLLAACGCIILFGTVTNLQLYGLVERFGWLPQSHLTFPETFQSFGAYTLALLVVGLLGETLADQLQETGRSLREKEMGLTILQAFHENIVRSISSGVFTADAQGAITSFNPAAQEATGHDLAKVIGRPWREVFNWHPNNSADDVTSQPGMIRFEVECKRADGDRLVLGMTLSPLHQQDNEDGLVGVFKDLTEMRDLEEEMRRKEWLANLGEMSAGMAHEIRNPLGALAGAMQMLRKSGVDETDRRLMDIAIREATRLDTIITEFLQYARPPALNLAEHDINKVLAETLDLVQHEARARPKLTIATALATEPLPVQVDQDQIRQVFWNLATNAFEAMPNGGQLAIGTGRRHIDVNGRKGDVIEISFHDQGEGIAIQNLDKIFLPFFTTKKYGSGLGLAAVHRIVDLHDGWIKVESDQQQGTQFVVCLPRSGHGGVRLWHEGRTPWKRS
ncbi:putative Sensor protein PilS [Nitrospira sp. KM1]|uniref:two-component system sensor histidine kinase NtrB n=1 Tax=Nitrospira sp. KM1 TaxID=1936990 RepID=UPI0013A7B3A5|nr:ATP-binding protein [Nitrospira sp. KM1]BCA55846.1 putative Sensor protein PilS [Nitrospira sp. KM1]